MKAIIYKEYGTPDVLRLEEIDKPIPKSNEVLIKVKATSINSWDWDLLRGEPFFVQLAGGGLGKPRKKILGCDIAGIVESVGKNVNKFKSGDEVYGDLSADGWGGFAEYVCADENSLFLKPESLTFEQAASLPQAGVLAYQGIHDYGKVKKSEQVLINGAGGGVGCFAIQLAKSCGAEVTAVDNAMKLERVRSLGADHVIDYLEEDFTKNGLQYDYILDVVGHHSLYDYRRALKRGGRYSMVGGPVGLILQSIFIGPVISLLGSKKLGILAHDPNKNLVQLGELANSLKLAVIVDKTFSLDETADAFRYFGENSFIGKIVVTNS